MLAVTVWALHSTGARHSAAQVRDPQGALERSLIAARVSFVFLVDGVADRTLRGMLQLSAKHPIAVVAGDLKDAEEGAAVAIHIADGRTRITVNLSAMKAQQVQLPAEVLALAQIIR